MPTIQRNLCGVCGSPVPETDSPDELVACPSCGKSVVRFDATSIPLLTRSLDGSSEPVRVSGISLTPDFILKYRLIRLVGTGGMGSVYLGRDELGRDVAIKFLLGLTDSDLLERFLRECRIQVSIDHPNVVKTIEAANLAGHPYLVTEYIDGGSLEDRLLRSQKLSLDESLRIACDVLMGLQACHDAGVIHRDVKPGNVMLEKSGRAKITDLGLAKLLEDDARALTKTGQVMGTPAYMPPEQAVGQTAVPASDIYSAGVILYEMLSGQRPYSAPSPVLLLQKKCDEDPEPVEEVCDLVPRSLGDLVRWSMARRIADRPASAKELAEALRSWLAGARRSRPTPRDSKGSVAVPDAVAGPAAASSGPPASDPERTEAFVQGPPSTSITVLPQMDPWVVRAFAALTIVGAITLAFLIRLTPAEPPAPDRSRTTVTLPRTPDVPAGPASPRETSGVRTPPGRADLEWPPVGEVERLLARVDTMDLPLVTWPSSGVCPLVVACIDNIRSVRVELEPGCTIRAPGGQPVQPGTAATPAAMGLTEGLNWFEVQSGGPGRVGTVRLERSSCEVARVSSQDVPPEVDLFDRLSEYVFLSTLDGNLEGARKITREMVPESEAYIREAILVRLDLEERDPLLRVSDLIETLDVDPIWHEPQRLERVRRDFGVLQSCFGRRPRRWDLWHTLGGGIRHVEPYDDSMARIALTRALSLWPTSYWTWWDLSRLEKRRWRVLSEGPQADPPAAAAHHAAAVSCLENAQRSLRAGRMLPYLKGQFATELKALRKGEWTRPGGAR